MEMTLEQKARRRLAQSTKSWAERRNYKDRTNRTSFENALIEVEEVAIVTYYYLSGPTSKGVTLFHFRAILSGVVLSTTFLQHI